MLIQKALSGEELNRERLGGHIRVKHGGSITGGLTWSHHIAGLQDVTSEGVTKRSDRGFILRCLCLCKREQKNEERQKKRTKIGEGRKPTGRARFTGRTLRS